MNETALREVRPVVIPIQYLVLGVPVAGFISIFPGFFTFIISNMIWGISRGLGFHGPIIVYGVVAYAIAFVLVMGLLYVKAFVEPKRTKYAIYRDRLEYDEGFANKHHRTLVFDQVIDIRRSEGVLQRTKNAGSIILTTQHLVPRGEGGLTNREITLTNIPEPQEVYELLRSLALERKDR